jgi:hypothetical protein
MFNRNVEMANRSRSGSQSYQNFDRYFFGSINDRKLLKMIFFSEYTYKLCQNKLKFYSSTDFSTIGEIKN